jgi:hypothetical protein
VDLSLLGRVLWRQKLVVLFGLVVAVALAVLSVYRPVDGELVRRTPTEYQSSAYLLVSTLSPFRAQEIRNTQTGQQIVTGLQASQLAGTYPYMILDSGFQEAIAKAANVSRSDYEIDAFRRTQAPSVNQNATLSGDNSLPVIEVKVTAESPDIAERVAAANTQAFVGMVTDQQNAAGIDPAERVSVSPIGQPAAAEAVGRSPLVLECIVFVGVMAVFLGLAFSLHNRRETKRASGSSSEAPSRSGGNERSRTPTRTAGSSVVDVRN